MIDNGVRSVVKYTFINSDNRKSEIYIQVKTATDSYKIGRDKKSPYLANDLTHYLLFASDFKSFLDTVDAFGIEDSVRMNYVDSKQKP